MASTQDRPNLVLIMADQHRFDWLGCAGADWVSTPNIDRLATRGVRFTQCCVNAPVCAPSRIALAAGQRPARLGALSNGSFLPLSRPTYYQRLRDHSYYVGCVGKLDLAKPDGYNGERGDRPATYAWGFTHPVECEGKMHAGRGLQGPYTRHLQERGLLETFQEDYTRRSKEGWAISCHDSPLPADAFEDSYIGQRSAQWIDDIPGDFPFHLFVSFVGPHDPFDPPTEYAEKYRDAQMPEAVPPAREGKASCMQTRAKDYDAELVTRTRRQYSAAVELIDDEVGRIMDALERKGVLDNTIVMFTADHGEMLGDLGMYQKSVPYEASLRVPLIAAGPGIQAGQVSDAMVELIDVNPTLCELAGVAPAENLDARSFTPVLRGEQQEHRDYAFSQLANFSLIRTREHKLVSFIEGHAELYDLQQDPWETTNVLEDNREVAKALSSMHSQANREIAWHR